MDKKDKETILRYINCLGKEILRDREIAIDLDEKISIEAKKIPKKNINKLLNLMGERLKIAKAILKNHENIHNMIDYAAEEGYEIIWKEYTAIDLLKKENLCDTNPFENPKFGG